MDGKRISPDRKKKLPLIGAPRVGTADDGMANTGSGEASAVTPLLIRALEVKGSGTSSRKASTSKKVSGSEKTNSSKSVSSSGKAAALRKVSAPANTSSKKPVASKAKPAAVKTSAKSPAKSPAKPSVKALRAGTKPGPAGTPSKAPAVHSEQANTNVPVSEPALATDSKPTPASEEVLSTDLSTLDPILESGAGEISVPLCAENIRAFSKYARLLKEWNEKMNLTNITDDKGIALRHFVDSLTLVSFLEAELKKSKRKSLSLIDVGTGAGFPGIPLKVALPWLQVTLLDSLRKRVGFLDTVCSELELSGIETVHSRAEDAGRSKLFRERFDVATARAVAPLPILCEYCLPFVKVGGIFLAMKGNADQEAEESTRAIVTLGGTIEDLRHFTLPGTDMNRSIIVIRKVRATPAKYPRQAGKPEKEPIV